MLSSSEAVVPSMNVFAMVLFAMRDRIFFCARNPISRALNALSVMTEKQTKQNIAKIIIKGMRNDLFNKMVRIN